MLRAEFCGIIWQFQQNVVSLRRSFKCLNMASTMHNTTGWQGVSTLDVLWAFYNSQPKLIKKAFRSRLETQEKSEEQQKPKLVQWKVDLKDIRLLKAGWDKENAPRISRDAISNVSNFVSTLSSVIANDIRLFHTHLGAVMLKYETGKGRIKCEMGDKEMSYFVKCKGRETKHHSFEDINSETLATLKSNLESIV